MTWYALAMFIGDKSELENLNFVPRGHHFKMARVEWNNVVLNPSGGDSYPVVDLSDWDLNECLFDLFGSLTLIEIFELFAACEDYPALAEGLDRKKFMNLQQRQWNQRLNDLFCKLNEAPPSFLEWAHKKQMGHRELQPLLSLPSVSSIEDLLNDFAEVGLSRNEGKVALDLIVDLVLLGQKTPSLKPEENRNWIDKLTQLRQPMAQKISRQASKEGWPQYVQVVNFRQGDRVLQKMQITYLDNEDLRGKLKRLAAKEPQP